MEQGKGWLETNKAARSSIENDTRQQGEQREEKRMLTLYMVQLALL